MVNRPSTPEIITVNSEALQTQIRDLLPSQNGFGSELQATNVITPIIDLTAAAEGSGLGTNLQTAISFGSQTAFDVTNTTTTLANSPGWYRVTATISVESLATVDQNPHLTMDDGLSTKKVWGIFVEDRKVEFFITVVPIDLVFFLGTGITLSAVSDSTGNRWFGSIRQIADSDGTLVNPSGYPL